MYKFRLITFCLLFSLTIPLIAQEEEEEPLPPKRASQAKIGGAGGFTQNILFLNINPIDDILRQSKASPIGKDPMLLLGGQGYGYIMLVPNLRIGGLGAGGSLVSKSYDPSTEIRRDVELSVSFGGATFEYAIPVVPRLDIAVGLMLGGGNTSITMLRNSNSNIIWDTVWNEYSLPNPMIRDYTRNLSGSFFIYQPSLNIEYAVLRWLGLRVGVSYNGMVVGNWKLDDKYDLIGVPDNINGQGVMINGGIFLGTFIY